MKLKKFKSKILSTLLIGFLSLSNFAYLNISPIYAQSVLYQSTTNGYNINGVGGRGGIYTTYRDKGYNVVLHIHVLE